MSAPIPLVRTQERGASRWLACASLVVLAGACASSREELDAPGPSSAAPQVASWASRSVEAGWTHEAPTLLRELGPIADAAPPAEAEVLRALETKLRALFAPFPSEGDPRALAHDAGTLLQRYREVSGAAHDDAVALSEAVLVLGGQFEAHALVEAERAWIDAQTSRTADDVDLVRLSALAMHYGGDSTRATLTALARCLALDRHDDTCQRLFFVRSHRFREPSCARVRRSDRFALYEVKADAPAGDAPLSLEHLVTPPALSGVDLDDVEPRVPGLDPSGRGQIRLTLTTEGAERFTALTTRLAPNGRVAIVVDGSVTSAPVVLEPIRGGAFSLALDDATLAAVCEHVRSVRLSPEMRALREQVKKDLRARGIELPD